jgi:hypothetical protein
VAPSDASWAIEEWRELVKGRSISSLAAKPAPLLGISSSVPPNALSLAGATENDRFLYSFVNALAGRDAEDLQAKPRYPATARVIPGSPSTHLSTGHGRLHGRLDR